MKITDSDLKMFQERARTELASGCDIESIAWDNVIRDLCNEIRSLRKNVGNVAALREALKLCVEQTCKRCRDDTAMHGNHAPCLNGCETMNRANAALAAPPRNCDVGTAREQEKRHKEEACQKSACPKHDGFVSNACKGCFAMWAQMPYEAKKGGDK